MIELRWLEEIDKPHRPESIVISEAYPYISRTLQIRHKEGIFASDGIFTWSEWENVPIGVDDAKNH